MAQTVYPAVVSTPASATISRFKYTATAGQTSVTGVDDNALTLSYATGKEQVYLNGTLLARNSDYTASSGTSITALSALALNDILEVITFTADSLQPTWSLVSSTSISASASTSITLPTGYSEFRFVQIATGTSGTPVTFSYRFNNNSGSVYPDTVAGSRTTFINTFATVYANNSPLVVSFDIIMPDLAVPHATIVQATALGSVSETSTAISGISTSSAITSVQILADGTAFTGTMYVYGVK